MQKFNKVPKFTRLQYILNDVTGWYLQSEVSNPEFNKLPTELKTAQAMQPFLLRQGAKECIKGHQLNYQKFFTGLRATQFINFYTGDNLNDPDSLILFDFSDDKTKLTIFYINDKKMSVRGLKPFLVRFKRAIIES